MSGTTTGPERHGDPSDPLSSIRNAMKSHDRRAKELQRHRLRFGLAAIALSPFAVLLLAIQVAYCPGTGLCAKLLIFLEALIHLPRYLWRPRLAVSRRYSVIRRLLWHC